MHICLIMDNPETPHHPVIAVALQQLSATHTIRLLDVRTLTGAQAISEEERHTLADLYLLKSHAPQALEVAHALEQKGALVVNSWASSVFATLEQLLADSAFLATLSYPVIIKSHFSHRGDLVDFVRDHAQLEALAVNWSKEPIVLQEYAKSDGWDIKLWVIDQQLFAARRRTPLGPNAPKEDHQIAPDELPGDWAFITLEIGRVFNMRLYGVDLLVTDKGPVIVDVNGFPGFRGVPGADRALVALVEKLAGERNTLV